jgi:hypothetical protein
LRQVTRSGERFALRDAAGALVERDEIRERAADIDGDTQVSQLSPLNLRRRRKIRPAEFFSATDVPRLYRRDVPVTSADAAIPDRSVRL